MVRLQYSGKRADCDGTDSYNPSIWEAETWNPWDLLDRYLRYMCMFKTHLYKKSENICPRLLPSNHVHTCPLHLVRVIISPWKPTFSDQQFNPISLLNIINKIYTIKVESIWQKSYLKSIKIYTYTTNLCSCRE